MPENVPNVNHPVLVDVGTDGERPCRMRSPAEVDATDRSAHVGFHPAWKYVHVHDLLFEHGRHVEVADVSPDMARLSMRIQDELKPGPGASSAQMEQWISGCFSRDYRNKARNA